jgi:signal transduction histidine kinase
MIFNRLKIKLFKTKLLLLIITISFGGLLIASTGFFWLINSNFKSNLENNALTNLNILSYNLAPAISFSDQDGAEEALQALAMLKHVAHASVYIMEQQQPTLLTFYNRSENHTPPNNILTFSEAKLTENVMQLTVPIWVDNEIRGYIYQYSVFQELSRFQRQTIIIVSITMLACLALSVLLSIKFQKILLRPLIKLIGYTETISKKKDYSFRLKGIGNDEFSLLSLSFNKMLEEIEQHYKKQKIIENEIRELNLSLEDNVKQRTQELATSNEDLRLALSIVEQSQEQLVENEKMASLGSLVAGVAHEINTPLGIGVTSNSLLSELITELDSKFTDNKISQNYLRSFIDKSKESTEICSFNLTRAAELINGFKQIAVDQSSDIERQVNIAAYINEIITSLKPKLKRSKHAIHVECNKDLTVMIRAGLFAQVITNLVMNSILHAFEDIEFGEIKITVTHNDKYVQIIYQDNGIGMEESALKKLFEPFYTTKRLQGGSGLGAHLVYNIITQGLNGTVTATSKVNDGLAYHINFPKNLT